ncbi:transcription antitermination factor NusB [Thermoactinomyces mirandus]|uniref:Transcription antitermination protein NusB n=1 Tax=Thermoactinomyces mirandus TaxID=2756294 RepID=A0A7W1XPI5_9BACL|nr:transcription antitermination factor NusB [Thermoactinomyces mirandus]MBA4600909.1 transcription antitermination factor NusB [Thermoactinomyces mirandus]
MSRRTVREKVIQTLYECEFHTDRRQEVVVSRSTQIDEKERPFFLHLAEGVMSRVSQLDDAIRPYLKKGWSVERLSTVDKMVLRLAAFELLYELTPQGVVINEAVELAKSFGGEDSGRFVNGILGKLAKNRPTQGTEA